MDDAPLQTRTPRGRAIHEIKTGDQVLSITVPWEMDYLPAKKSSPEKETPTRPAVKRTPVPIHTDEDGRKALPATKQGTKSTPVKKAAESNATQLTLEMTEKPAPKRNATKSSVSKPASVLESDRVQQEGCRNSKSDYGQNDRNT